MFGGEGGRGIVVAGCIAEIKPLMNVTGVWVLLLLLVAVGFFL